MASEFGENKYKKYGQPTLDLQFSGPKGSIRNRADGGAISVEFTRTQDTQASYYKSDGTIGYASTDVPRFDHDPTTGESLGLLIEESRTNILQRSSDFANSYWSKYQVTIDPNVETAPDGTTTASKMQWSSSSNRNCVFVQPTTDVTQTYTCSFYAKADEWNFAAVAIQTPGGSSPYYRITVNLTTGAIAEYTSASAPTNTSAIATSLPNGWWRVSATANVNDSGKTQVQMEVGMSPNNTYGGSVSGTPDGTSGIYIWGAQEEQGSFPTSLIPTSGSTSTRGADVAKITGTNFTDFYNQNEGTAFVNYKTASTEQFNSPFSFRVSEASDAQSWGHWTYNGGSQSRVPIYGQRTSPNETQYLIGTFDSIDLNRYYKVGISQDGSNMSGCIETDTTRTRSMTALPTMSVLALGWVKSTSTIMTGHISRLTYWPRRLSDSDLQRLTE